MKGITNLEKAVQSITGNPKLDRSVKSLLADPQVIARILKHVMEEFRDESIDDIMNAIEGKPLISSVPVEPGLTNAEKDTPELHKLDGESTERGMSKEDALAIAGLKEEDIPKE